MSQSWDYAGILNVWSGLALGALFCHLPCLSGPDLTKLAFQLFAFSISKRPVDNSWLHQFAVKCMVSFYEY